MRSMVLVGAFAAIAVLMGFDLFEDWRSSREALHLGLEAVVMAIALGGVAAMGRIVLQERQAARRALADAQQDAAQARRQQQALAEEAARWRREAEASLRGLGEDIERQFERWELTPAEAEVGLLLLKGLSTKEIAQVREVSDRTVRQQARAVYAKGGLAGRAELAAFFLEDLLLPGGGQASSA